MNDAHRVSPLRSPLIASLVAAGAIVAVATVAACGAKAAPTTPAAGGEPVVGARTHAPGGFDSLTHEQKVDLMKTQVLPIVGGHFQAFDSKRWDSPDCSLCHGERAFDGDFEMPNPDLPKLDLANLDKLSAEDQAVAQFMRDKVVPEMSRILGEEPYGPEHPDGFGCMKCHTAP